MSFISGRAAGLGREVRVAALVVFLLYTGEFLVATALLLRLHDQGASGAVVAGLMLATAVPMVLAAPLSGTLVDRTDSRRLLIGAGVVQIVTCAALAWTDHVAGVLGLVAVLALGFSVASPTLSSLVPSMVGPDALPAANSLVTSANTVGLVLGPVLGGVLTGAYGTRVPVFVATVLYAAAAAATLLLRTRRQPRASARRETTGGFRTSVRLLRADPVMTTQLAMTTIVAVLLQVTNVAEVFLVRGTLGASATVFGLVGACWMAGMFAGAWIAGLAARGDGALLRWSLGAAAVQAAALAGVAVVPGAWWLMPLFALGGIGNGAMNVVRQTTFGRRAPEHARGRIFSVVTAVSNLGSVLSLAVGGVVVGVADPRVVYGVCGVLCVLAAAGYARPLLRVASQSDQTAAERSPTPVVALRSA